LVRDTADKAGTGLANSRPERVNGDPARNAWRGQGRLHRAL